MPAIAPLEDNYRHIENTIRQARRSLDESETFLRAANLLRAHGGDAGMLLERAEFQAGCVVRMVSAARRLCSEQAEIKAALIADIDAKKAKE